MISVLFVCLGNICRSPTAHGTFRQLVEEHGLSNKIKIDSAGTAPYHIGKKADERAQSVAKSRGINLSDLRARQVSSNDFETFDYILAMDRDNLSDLLERCSPEHQHKVKLFLRYAQNSEFDEVPDPYYGGQAGFDLVFDLVKEASEGLLNEIIRTSSIQ